MHIQRLLYLVLYYTILPNQVRAPLMTPTASTLSQCMDRTVSAILPKRTATISSRTSAASKIDLEAAENWLLRPELVALSKEAITEHLNEGVRDRHSDNDQAVKGRRKKFFTFVPY